MGMYTDFCFDAEFKANTPSEITELLTAWSKGDDLTNDLPDHPFFKCDRWSFIGHCCSYYFDSKPLFRFEFDSILNKYTINIRCNLKNYSDEIEKFCDWIYPYLAKAEGEFLGFSRYEKDQTPTLIFMPKT
jgi:hypothetical protein